jgi:formate C-acetyltransferase
MSRAQSTDTDTVEGRRMALATAQAQHFVDTLAATEPVIPEAGILAGPLRRTVSPETPNQLGWDADNLHFPMDVGNLMRLGSAGIARRALANAAGRPAEQAHYLKCIAATYEAVCCFIASHAAAAEGKIRGASASERHRLEAIAANCRALSVEPPRTFAQAVQLFWFVHCIRVTGWSSTIGRLDQHLFPFYRADAAGGLTREDALELLCELWRGLNRQVPHPSNGLMNLMVGGQDAAGNDAANEVSYLLIDTAIRVNDTNPFVSARVHARTEKRFLDKVIELQLVGHGQGTVYNDELIIPSLVRYGLPLELARNYANDGCNEITIDGQSTICLWIVDALKCLEAALFDGKENPSAHQAPRRLLLATEQPLNLVDQAYTGFQSGAFNAMRSFDEFLEAFMRQYLHHIDRALRDQGNLMKQFAANGVSSPLMAGTFASVLESGLDPHRGGVEVIEQVVFLGSLGTVADGLAAVKKVVFEERACAPEQLLEALAADWKGHDALRALCRAAPKFGNDDDDVDLIIADVIRRAVDHMKRAPSFSGLPVWPCLFNHAFVNSAQMCGATPDGRRWMDPVGEHFSPTPGCAVHGPTAVIRSATKAPLADCVGVAIFHIGLARSLAPQGERSRALIENLIRTAFRLGATVINVAIYDVATLKEARLHPEKYPDLIVRVWGYSARFTSLSGDMQDHIIARAIQGAA